MEAEEKNLMDESLPFEPIHYTAKNLLEQASCYHVYKDNGEVVEVEADSAYEAMAKSGVRQPARIQKYALNRLQILDGSHLQPNQFTAQPAITLEPEALPVAEVAEAQSVPEIDVLPAAAALSEEEISRLTGPE